MVQDALKYVSFDQKNKRHAWIFYFFLTLIYVVNVKYLIKKNYLFLFNVCVTQVIDRKSLNIFLTS